MESNSHPNLRWWAMVHHKRFRDLTDKLELEDRGTGSEAVAWQGVQVCQ